MSARERADAASRRSPPAPADQGDCVAGPPVLRVLRGEPSDEELAALVAVLAARSVAARVASPPRRQSAWGDPASAVRRPLSPGPDGWRRSALPG